MASDKAEGDGGIMAEGQEHGNRYYESLFQFEQVVGTLGRGGRDDDAQPKKFGWWCRQVSMPLVPP